MPQTVVPIIHVPDVSATVAWYARLGFKVIGTNEEDGEANWAKISLGGGEVMFDSGGETSNRPRREMDLYALTDNVDDLYQRLKDQVQIVQELYNAFYGMREFIIRDLNGFWVSFGQPIRN